MRTPNTTFDVYLDNHLPPATPDAAGLSGYLFDAWHQGNEVSEGDRTFFYTSILEAPLGTNLPDAYPAAAGATTVWAPDSAGQGYRVVYVERERRFPGNDFLRAYLVRGTTMAITVQEADGSPLLTNITTLIFDQADGFTVSQPAANQARIDLSLTSYTDEQAQDAVGTILVDSSTIDFTYSDSTPSITADVKASSIGPSHLQSAAPGSSSSGSGSVPFWVEVTKTHADLAAAATSNDIEVYSLPAGGVVHEAALIHTVQFAGTGFVQYSISLGKTGNSGYHIGPRDVLGAVNDAPSITSGIMRFDDYDSAVSVRIFATCFGANLNAATAGTVKIYLLVSKPKP